MKGAEILIHTALREGVELCFANPGTTEMPIVQAMDAVPGMRPVLCLQEDVCTGAADGYGRMTGKPAMVLLHLGPGLANGISNLHNARRARTPVFTVVGEHATWHKVYDPPLAMNIEALAGTVSGWQKTPMSVTDIRRDTAQAIEACRHGQIATLIVPYDFQLEDALDNPVTMQPYAVGSVDAALVEKASGLLRSGRKTLLMLGGKTLQAQGLLTAARIKAKCGCDLMAEMFPARMDHGAGLPDVPRVPYMPEIAIDMISKYEVIILVGARIPVSFFGYMNLPSLFVNECQETFTLAGENELELEALTALAGSLDAPSYPPEDMLARAAAFPFPTGDLTPDKISMILAALQPEGAVIVDEAITTGLTYHAISAGSKPYTLLTLTGGSLGQGMPCAAGAAIASPDRRIISFQADGAALYTLQALWTQARENLNVITLVASNRRYDILRYELMRLNILSPGPAASRLTELPGIDWVKTGESFGVPSVAVTTAENLIAELSRALDEKGPRLIEMKI